MIVDFLDPQIEIFGKLALAMILGMLVGMERTAAGKSAGGRTFALVSIGACLFIIVSNLANAPYLGLVNFDPMRVAAAVIMGIGFIGGGIIFLQNNSAPQGLTTAAGLWLAAGIGMAVGFGFYLIAIFTSMLMLIVFTLMWRVEYWIQHFFMRFEQAIIVRPGDRDKNSIPDNEEKLPVVDQGPHI